MRGSKKCATCIYEENFTYSHPCGSCSEISTLCSQSYYIEKVKEGNTHSQIKISETVDAVVGEWVLQKVTEVIPCKVLGTCELCLSVDTYVRDFPCKSCSVIVDGLGKQSFFKPIEGFKQKEEVTMKEVVKSEHCIRCVSRDILSDCVPCNNCMVIRPGDYGKSFFIPREKELPSKPVIKDSGALKEFVTGAVSDIDEAKHDIGKPRCDLVSPSLIEAVGHIRGYGVEKYKDPDNWKQVGSDRYMAALIRHLCHCMRDLSSVDEESGYPHLWHVACNINFLVERLENMKEGV